MTFLYHEIVSSVQGGAEVIIPLENAITFAKELQNISVLRRLTPQESGVIVNCKAFRVSLLPDLNGINQQIPQAEQKFRIITNNKNYSIRTSGDFSCPTLYFDIITGQQELLVLTIHTAFATSTFDISFIHLAPEKDTKPLLNCSLLVRKKIEYSPIRGQKHENQEFR